MTQKTKTAPRKKPAAPENLPIELSGSVFFIGILANKFPTASMPLKVVTGDIKLHSVQRDGEIVRFGQTFTYKGLISASIRDGQRWRRLLLRQLHSAEPFYTTDGELYARADALLRHLKTLKRKQAGWFEKHSGYVVSHDVATTVVEPAAEVQVAPTPSAVPSTTVASTAPVTEAVAKPQLVAPKRRRRKSFVDEKQLWLFCDEKAS